MNFFEFNGIYLKEEDYGCMFFVIDKLKLIVDVLFNCINELGVIVFIKI